MLLNGSKYTKGNKRIYRSHYTVGKKKEKRTMCVVYSNNKKIGMITAYWEGGISVPKIVDPQERPPEGAIVAAFPNGVGSKMKVRIRKKGFIMGPEGT